MTFTRMAMLTALLFYYAVPAGAQSVRLEFHDGKVTVMAQNAPLRTILTEWGRLGATQVVNIERLAGPPVTLQLTDVPETQALDIILRGTAGYIAGLRPPTEPVGARSSLDRIMVVPTAGTAATVTARPAVTPPPFATAPAFRPPVEPDNAVSDVPPDEDGPNRARTAPPVNVPRAVVGPAPPPQPFPPQDNEQPQQPPPTATPANPFGIQTGSPRPGTISPAPPQPNQRPRPQPDPEP